MSEVSWQYKSSAGTEVAPNQSAIIIIIIFIIIWNQ
jgi:hypothetical protein